MEKVKEVTENKSTQPIVNIAKDTTEALLDNLIPLLKDYPILKDIPVLNIVHSLAQGYSSLRDYSFYKKIEKLYHNLETFTEDEKNNFINQMNNDEGFKSKVVENLLLIIEKLDDMDKPKIISKLYTEYIRLHITYKEFNRLCKGVIDCPINSLNKITHVYEHLGVDWTAEQIEEQTDILQDLYLSGLLQLGKTIGSIGSYITNQLGKLYIQSISR